MLILGLKMLLKFWAKKVISLKIQGSHFFSYFLMHVIGYMFLVGIHSMQG